jgi:hypothetical protein
MLCKNSRLSAYLANLRDMPFTRRSTAQEGFVNNHENMDILSSTWHLSAD